MIGSVLLLVLIAAFAVLVLSAIDEAAGHSIDAGWKWMEDRLRAKMTPTRTLILGIGIMVLLTVLGGQ